MTLAIVYVYSSPNGYIAVYRCIADVQQKCLFEISGLATHVVLCGHLNINFQEQNINTKNLLNMFSSFGMLNLVNDYWYAA